MNPAPWKIGLRYVMHIDGMEAWGTLASVTDHELLFTRVVYGCAPSAFLPRSLALGGIGEPEPGTHWVTVPEMIVSRGAHLIAAESDLDRPDPTVSMGPYRRRFARSVLSRPCGTTAPRISMANTWATSAPTVMEESSMNSDGLS